MAKALSIMSVIFKILVIQLILSLAFPPIAYPQDVTYIEAGTKAPYSGFLFTPEKTNEQRLITLERDSFKLLNVSLQSSLELQRVLNSNTENKVAILLEQNDKLAVRLYEERSSSTWERIFWVGLGVVAVIGGGLGLKAASK